MDIERLTTLLPQGAGENLRYDALYDQVKEARTEEDATLSRGVWERELKKADWSAVQHLCEEALSHRTKDLQLIAWLGDAACHLDKWSGFKDALDLMAQFCHRCWEHCYPMEDSGQPDMDFRLRILEWYVERLEEHVLFLPLTKSSALLVQSLDMATWQSAQNFDLVSKRLAGQGAPQDESQITLTRFRTLIRQVEGPFLQKIQSFVVAAQSSTRTLAAVWGEVCQGQEPSLSRINEVLAEINRLCSFALEGRVVNTDETVVEPDSNPHTVHSGEDPPPPSEAVLEPQVGTVIPSSVESDAMPASGEPTEVNEEGTTTITDRQGAYQAVNDLADYLIHLDPQTPGPYLLKMVSFWGEKSLPDILDDVVEGQSEGHRVLRMMVGVLRSRKE